MKRFLLLLAITISAFGADYIPDSDRRIDWSYGVTTGIPGGIPDRETIFANVTAAPYNADKTGMTSAHGRSRRRSTTARPIKSSISRQEPIG